MTDNIDLESFEPFLVKGLSTDSSILPNLVEHIDKSIFTNKDLGLLSMVIKMFYNKRKRVPTKDEIFLLLKDESHKKQINNAYSLIEPINYDACDKDFFIDNAQTFIRSKLFWNEMVNVASKINSESLDHPKILKTFEKICTIDVKNSDGGFNLFKDCAKIAEYLKVEKRYISTGYPSLDKYIGGGLLADGKAIYTFMAPPGKGKSLFLGNIAANVAKQGKNVLVISLEMAEIVYGLRFSSQISNIPMAMLEHNRDNLVNSLSNEPGEIIIKEFPTGTLSVDRLKTWIDNNYTKKGKRLDLIVVDYLNLLTTPVGTSLYEKIKDIIEGLRSLTYFFSCPLVTATQQNRSADGTKMTGQNSVAESMGVPQTTDLLCEIFKQPEDTVIGKIRLGIAKNRYGQEGVAIVLDFDKDTLKITDGFMEENFSSNYMAAVAEIENSLESVLG